MQFLPIGETLIIPFLYSIKVPLLTGILMSAMYFRQKLISSYNFSSPSSSAIDFFVLLIKYFLKKKLVLL